jgi:hypothetical protein
VTAHIEYKNGSGWHLYDDCYNKNGKKGGAHVCRYNMRKGLQLRIRLQLYEKGVGYGEPTFFKKTTA